MKTINAEQFVSLIRKKINNVDFTPIILFGRSGAGKSSVCDIACKIIGNVLDESYTLYFSDIKLQKTKKLLMSEICDRASQDLIQVFSTTDINVANAFGKVFGLNIYNLDENVGRDIRLRQFKKPEPVKNKINLNLGDKILDLQMSKLNGCNVYAVVLVVDGYRVTCKEIDPNHERHYPHKFYYFQENKIWKRV